MSQYQALSGRFPDRTHPYHFCPTSQQKILFHNLFLIIASGQFGTLEMSTPHISYERFVWHCLIRKWNLCYENILRRFGWILKLNFVSFKIPARLRRFRLDLDAIVLLSKSYLRKKIVSANAWIFTYF